MDSSGVWFFWAWVQVDVWYFAGSWFKVPGDITGNSPQGALFVFTSCGFLFVCLIVWLGFVKHTLPWPYEWMKWSDFANLLISEFKKDEKERKTPFCSNTKIWEVCFPTSSGAGSIRTNIFPKSAIILKSLYYGEVCLQNVKRLGPWEPEMTVNALRLWLSVSQWGLVIGEWPTTRWSVVSCLFPGLDFIKEFITYLQTYMWEFLQ